MNVTVSGYNRPAYLERTLAALAKCDGVRDCRVRVLLDPCDETAEQTEIAARYGFPVSVHASHVGCNTAIQQAFRFGFSEQLYDYHVHLEDDTVPTKDALRWFAWARDRYRDDPRVMNVSGYQRSSDGEGGHAAIRRWFTPWGWATWRDRWFGLDAGWAKNDAISWDVVVNYLLRAGRYEAFPTVSRIQNIGAEKGTHVPNAEWHAANHHVAVTADDLLGGPFPSWAHTREDERADHA